MHRLALVLLAGLAAGPARADVIYAYSFGGNATGQFTTWAAAVDPGYFLVTSLNILTFTQNGGGPLSVIGGSATQFDSGAAYNPTTGAFLNHAGGSTFPNIGQVLFTGSIGGHSITGRGITGSDFSLGSTQLQIRAQDNFNLRATGPLTIQQAAGTPTPEPATLAVFGLLGVGGLVYRRKTAGA